MALFADLVAYVDKNPAYTRDGSNTGVMTDKFRLTYSQMYNDLRAYVVGHPPRDSLVGLTAMTVLMRGLFLL